MNKPAPFVVQPEWRDKHDLYAGSTMVGWVTRFRTEWLWSASVSGATGTTATRTEARAAVEAAVREALGGKPV
jgi:hypothetical protein